MGAFISWFVGGGVKWVSGLFALFAVGYFVDEWHYTPILKAEQKVVECKSSCSDKLKQRDNAIKKAGDKINSLANRLQECRDRQSVESLESYIKSLGDLPNEDKSFDINFSNYTF